MTFEMTWNDALGRKFKIMLLNAVVTYTNSGNYVPNLAISGKLEGFIEHVLFFSSWNPSIEPDISYKCILHPACEGSNFFFIFYHHAVSWLHCGRMVWNSSGRTIDHNRDSFSLLTAKVMENTWNIVTRRSGCADCYSNVRTLLWTSWMGFTLSFLSFIYLFIYLCVHYTWVLKLILNFILHDYIYCWIT
jgi:hypothetical protein